MATPLGSSPTSSLMNQQALAEKKSVKKLTSNPENNASQANQPSNILQPKTSSLMSIAENTDKNVAQLPNKDNVEKKNSLKDLAKPLAILATASSISTVGATSTFPSVTAVSTITSTALATVVAVPTAIGAVSTAIGDRIGGRTGAMVGTASGIVVGIGIGAATSATASLMSVPALVGGVSAAVGSGLYGMYRHFTSSSSTQQAPAQSSSSSTQQTPAQSSSSSTQQTPAQSSSSSTQQTLAQSSSSSTQQTPVQLTDMSSQQAISGFKASNDIKGSSLRDLESSFKDYLKSNKINITDNSNLKQDLRSAWLNDNPKVSSVQAPPVLAAPAPAIIHVAAPPPPPALTVNDLHNQNVYSGPDMINWLTGQGFTQTGQTGSHVQLTGPNGEHTTVPNHGTTELGRGLMTAILQQSGFR